MVLVQEKFIHTYLYNIWPLLDVAMFTITAIITVIIVLGVNWKMLFHVNMQKVMGNV